MNHGLKVYWALWALWLAIMGSDRERGRERD